MGHSLKFVLRQARRQFAQMLSGPQALASVPAITPASFWFGGEAWLLLAALGLPIAHAATGVFSTPNIEPEQTQPPAEDKWLALDQALQVALGTAERSGRATGCIMLAVDDMPSILARYGQGATEAIILNLSARMTSSLREGDRVIRISGGEFGVALAPMRHLYLEAAIQMAGRLQLVVEEPISLDATTIFVSCSVGF